MFKVTSVAALQAAEGMRISYTYSEIDDTTQDVVNSNVRRSIVLSDTDTDVLSAINTIISYAKNNLDVLTAK